MYPSVVPLIIAGGTFIAAFFNFKNVTNRYLNLCIEENERQDYIQAQREKREAAALAAIQRAALQQASAPDPKTPVDE